MYHEYFPNEKCSSYKELNANVGVVEKLLYPLFFFPANSCPSVHLLAVILIYRWLSHTMTKHSE